VALALVFLSLDVAAQPTATSSLPTVPLERFAPAARDDIAPAYEQARSRSDDGEAVGALAMRLQAWDQFEMAAAMYARAQALAPDAVEWWYLGGLTAQQQALWRDAVRQFERAARLAPDTPLITLRLADSRLAAGDIDGARTLYRALTSVPACAASAWYGLGRVLVVDKAHGEARAAFEQALALSPEFGAAHYALAQLQRQSGDVEAARLSLLRQQRCMACWPMPPDPWREQVAVLRTDAAALLTRGIDTASAGTAAANAEAIRLHERALEEAATRGQAHVNLIELYGRTGNVDAALEHYQAAVGEPGFAADVHRAYAAVLLTLKRPEDALTLFSKAAALAPTDPAAHHGQGLALEMLDRPVDAASAFRRALDVAPTMRPARFGLARVSMRLKQADEAIALLEELREPRDAESAQYLFALSVALVRTGRVDAARQAAQDAVDVARRFGDERTAAAIEAEMRKLPRTP
jgi:tetratricopeptide (TPR) repeat protein